MDSLRGVVFATFAAFFLSNCLGSPVTSQRSCIGDSNGKAVCSFSNSDTLSMISSRQVCSSNDYACTCIKSVEYNNQIRARHGHGPIAVGTVAMLNNAVRHSQSFVSGPFKHQQLSDVTAEIQCGTFCSGENIALFTGHADDPAKTCMDLWENSPEHLDNILRGNDFTVIGIYEQDGTTYCTQTFGLRGQVSGSESGQYCNAVGNKFETQAPAVTLVPSSEVSSTSTQSPVASSVPSLSQTQNPNSQPDTAPCVN
jgi:hypothetical protein